MNPLQNTAGQALRILADAWAEMSASPYLQSKMGLPLHLPHISEDAAARRAALGKDLVQRIEALGPLGRPALPYELALAVRLARANSQMAEPEIRTESIRYSCDIPGQSLAYKLGDTVMFELRARMQAARGAGFSLNEFHHAVLHPGALPLPDLAFHLDHVTATSAAHA